MLLEMESGVGMEMVEIGSFGVHYGNFFGTLQGKSRVGVRKMKVESNNDIKKLRKINETLKQFEKWYGWI